MAVSDIRLTPLLPIGFGTDALFCLMFIEFRENSPCSSLLIGFKATFRNAFKGKVSYRPRCLGNLCCRIYPPRLRWIRSVQTWVNSFYFGVRSFFRSDPKLLLRSAPSIRSKKRSGPNSAPSLHSNRLVRYLIKWPKTTKRIFFRTLVFLNWSFSTLIRFIFGTKLI